jgi:hypothetical protein
LSASLVIELLEQGAHLDRRHFARIGPELFEPIRNLLLSAPAEAAARKAQQFPDLTQSLLPRKRAAEAVKKQPGKGV